MVTTMEPVRPSAEDVSAADKALEQLRTYLAQHPDGPTHVRLVGDDDGSELVVPRVAVELLTGVLAHLAAGRGVSIMPAHAELTTQQAADILNVSRPYLIGLLESGEIEHRKVGKHRRVKMESLMDYVRRDDQRRREAADELTALTQEMG